MIVIALEFKKETPLGFCSFSLFTPTFLTTLKFIFVPVLQEELKGDRVIPELYSCFPPLIFPFLQTPLGIHRMSISHFLR